MYMDEVVNDMWDTGKLSIQGRKKKTRPENANEARRSLKINYKVRLG